MADGETFKALGGQTPKFSQEEEDEDEEFGEEDEEEELGEVEVREAQLETLAVSSSLPLENDRVGGLEVNSASETIGRVEFKVQVGMTNQEVLASATTETAQAQTQNQHQSSMCPTSSSELSPTSVTQYAPSPTQLEQKPCSPKVNSKLCVPETDQKKCSDRKTPSVITITKTPASDGFNWRKYGQKLVKSPKGFRSYYRCTYSDCCAKKIDCCDHSGCVIEIVYKAQHNHDPPRKIKCTRESRLASSAGPVVQNNVTEHPNRLLNNSVPSTSTKEPIQETPPISERKRQHSSASDGNGDVTVKEEHVNEPESKQRQVFPRSRLKKSNLAHSGSLLKPGKKPKFVVHAAGDVGISGDGYRWRKYGQKMVKGNPHPRNYYRCTSAGCPVRKHIETAIDNTSAVIITYKGIHDHDMPVPKKRHGPPSPTLVAAAAPASMNNVQFKKTDSFQKRTSSTQWSVDPEGELNAEASDLGGEKAIESARTLLSIGFEIKPC